MHLTVGVPSGLWINVGPLHYHHGQSTAMPYSADMLLQVTSVHMDRNLSRSRPPHVTPMVTLPPSTLSLSTLLCVQVIQSIGFECLYSGRVASDYCGESDYFMKPEYFLSLVFVMRLTKPEDRVSPEWVEEIHSNGT